MSICPLPESGSPASTLPRGGRVEWMRDPFREGIMSKRRFLLGACVAVLGLAFAQTDLALSLLAASRGLRGGRPAGHAGRGPGRSGGGAARVVRGAGIEPDGPG